MSAEKDAIERIGNQIGALWDALSASQKQLQELKERGHTETANEGAIEGLRADLLALRRDFQSLSQKYYMHLPIGHGVIDENLAGRVGALERLTEGYPKLRDTVAGMKSRVEPIPPGLMGPQMRDVYVVTRRNDFVGCTVFVDITDKDGRSLRLDRCIMELEKPHGEAFTRFGPFKCQRR